MNRKDHPLIVAVTAIVSTTAILVAVVFTAVIPTWVRHDQQEIADLRKQLGDLQKQLGDFGTARDVLEAKSKKIEELEAEITKQRLGWVLGFRSDDPYPVSILNLKIGASVADFERAYAFKKEKIQILDDWLTLNFQSGPFSEATIYCHPKEPSSTVTSILFHFRDEDGFKVVRNEALKTFGTATLKYENRNGVETWKWEINRTEVELGELDYFLYRL